MNININLSNNCTHAQGDIVNTPSGNIKRYITQVRRQMDGRVNRAQWGYWDSTGYTQE